jgi:type IV secretory pathway TrbF-like protein
MATNATRQFVEAWGSTAVLNRWLQVGLGMSVIVNMGLTGALVHATNKMANYKPLVVRMTEDGQGQAPVAYDSLTLQPQEKDIRSALGRFAMLHYGRMRATVRRDYPASFMFLDSRLSLGLVGGGKGPVEAFLENPGAPDIDVQIKEVVLEEMETTPYRARVVYAAHSLHGNTTKPVKTEVWTAQIAFVLRDDLPNEFVLQNPVGLQILQLQSFQAFE